VRAAWRGLGLAGLLGAMAGCLDVQQAFPRLTDVSVGRDEACGRQSGGGARCLAGALPKPSYSDAWQQVSVGDDLGCAFDGSYVKCWSRHGSMTPPTFTSSGYDGVSVGGSTACVLDYGVTCEGPGAVANSGVRYESYDWLAVHDDLACGRRREAVSPMDCWGKASRLPPVPLPPLEQLDIGPSHACGIVANGNDVLCWGEGYSTSHTLPGNYLSVSIGGTTTCALGASGRVDCWDKDFTATSALTTDLRFTALDLGSDPNVPNGCGVTATGHGVACWGNVGSDYSGKPLELALERRTNASLSGPAASHTCVWQPDGHIQCWGANDAGQLGLGDTRDRGVAPGQMGAGLPAVDVGTDKYVGPMALGARHTCAVLTDGSVRCWGANERGQLGLGDTVARGGRAGQMGDALPGVDLGMGESISDVELGDAFSCAHIGPAVQCWGANDRGQLGVGDTVDRGASPTSMGPSLSRVPLGTDVAGVRTGRAHVCAVSGGGSLMCWGANDRGQLGLGDTLPRGVAPGQVASYSVTVPLGSGRTVYDLAMGAQHTCVVLDTGKVKCWGDNTLGQLGLGSSAPMLAGDPTSVPSSLGTVDLGASVAWGVTATATSTCAMLLDGTLKCWGDNRAGQLGLGDTLSRGRQVADMGARLPPVNSTQQQIGVATGGAGFVCATYVPGRQVCWGANARGQLGQGDSAPRGGTAATVPSGLDSVAFW
jgi:alpha-tubulin suppressor-like RCC1 family protein